MDSALFASIELGGTKIVAGVGRADGTTIDCVRLPTGLPSISLPEVVAALVAMRDRHGPLAALGIGAFGPVNVDSADARFGLLGATPKAGWAGVDLIEAFAPLGLPVALQTDVAMAAIAEANIGVARGLRSVVYMTIGTGIGGALCVDGRILSGASHSEMGHMRVPRAAEDAYSGGCRHHGDCVEGLAAGPSIIARWGTTLDALPKTHAAFSMLAHYIGHLLANVIFTLVPDRIVVGGGVMHNGALMPLVRNRVRSLLNDYLPIASGPEDMSGYIVAPALPDAAFSGGLLAASNLIEPGGRPPT